MPVPLFLASASPARLATLTAAGVDPVVRVSDVDEDAVVAAREVEWGRALAPEETVLLLAQAKAENVAALLHAEGVTEGLVLGGDSVFVLDEQIYGKPHEPAVARERWQKQQGRTGHLYSGHWLIDLAQAMGEAPNGDTAEKAGAAGEVAIASVTFASDISDAELEAYIHSGEPLTVAGAFTIDSLGAAFIDRIEGDPSTVIGVSVPTVRRLVKSLGHEWVELWR